MANIIGIDLGTSTSLLAHLSNSGEAHIFKNKDGDEVTPSAVWFDEGYKVVIGKEAKNVLGVSQNDKIFIEFKRDMGDPNVVHKVNGKDWRPRDFSALVLKQMREHFEENNGPIDAVIITIPANFTNEARVDTLNAAKEAGLKLNDDALVNEPTAAAIYYASTSPTKLKGKYLIYDFGGGTFDATILEVDGDDIKVITSKGVQRLGGKDMDDKLIQLIGEKYSKLTGNHFAGGNEGLYDIQLTRANVEGFKHTLSTREKVEIPVRTLDRGLVRISITRNEFTEAISTLITQAELAVETALSNAKIEAKDLSGVFLAGGSTLVPAVAQSVERHLGIKPISRNPVCAVALGACVYAAIKNKSKVSGAAAIALAAKKIQDVSPHYFGAIYLEQSSGRLKVENIIAKDTPLPCVQFKSFSRSGSQTAVKTEITQSSSLTEDVDFVHIVRSIKLENLPVVEGNENEIKVTYKYDENGVMSCTILDVFSGKSFDTTLNKRGESGDNRDGEIDINKYTLE
jgi:molecular chaperone DnaK